MTHVSYIQSGVYITQEELHRAELRLPRLQSRRVQIVAADDGLMTHTVYENTPGSTYRYRGLLRYEYTSHVYQFDPKQLSKGQVVRVDEQLQHLVDRESWLAMQDTPCLYEQTFTQKRYQLTHQKLASVYSTKQDHADKLILLRTYNKHCSVLLFRCYMSTSSNEHLDVRSVKTFVRRIIQILGLRTYVTGL